jgi:hypothetical protein
VKVTFSDTIQSKLYSLKVPAKTTVESQGGNVLVIGKEEFHSHFNYQFFLQLGRRQTVIQS